MAKGFASALDLQEKKSTFEELAKGVYAYITEGDPNTGVIIGNESVMVIDTRATPVLAQEFIGEIRTVTDLPIEHIVLTHYHAVRVLGASAYNARYIVAHSNTRNLVFERGQQDWESETGRFPRLFRSAESIPGLTYPNVTFNNMMSFFFGEREVRLLYLGRGHTSGDIAIYVPQDNILFSGDLVEANATPYAGDAYIEDWMETLERVRGIKAAALVPGRGPTLYGAEVDAAINEHKAFLMELRDSVVGAIRKEATLKQAYDAAYAALQPRFGHWTIFEHCMPFDVSRAYDELSGTRPRIWTATRDQEMWKALQGE